MGLFDFLGNNERKARTARIRAAEKALKIEGKHIPSEEKKYYRPDSYYTPIVAEGTQFEQIVMPFEERKKISYPSKNGLYIAEILLLEYCTYGKYPNPPNGYPGLWWFEYGIRDVNAVLKSLEKRGFIILSFPDNLAEILNVSVLKDILRDHGLPVSGKKSALVERVNNNISKEYMLRYMPGSKYKLTELGESELSENRYVAYMHNYPHKTTEGTQFDRSFNVWSVNKLIHDSPKCSWRGILWAEFNERSNDYAINRKWGLYRNVRLQMADFSFEEKRYKDALAFLSEVIHLDFNSDSMPFFAKSLIDKLIRIQAALQLTPDEIMSLVQNRIGGMYVPVCNSISSNTAGIITAYCIGNTDLANKAVSQLTNKKID